MQLAAPHEWLTVYLSRSQDLLPRPRSLVVAMSRLLGLHAPQGSYLQVPCLLQALLHRLESKHPCH